MGRQNVVSGGLGAGTGPERTLRLGAQGQAAGSAPAGLAFILVRVFVVQAEAGPAETINLHNIGLTPVCTACVYAVTPRRSCTRRRWGVEASRAGIMCLRIGAQVFISEIRGCSVEKRFGVRL